MANMSYRMENFERKFSALQRKFKYCREESKYNTGTCMLEILKRY